jgi:hypothetical protein
VFSKYIYEACNRSLKLIQRFYPSSVLILQGCLSDAVKCDFGARIARLQVNKTKLLSYVCGLFICLSKYMTRSYATLKALKKFLQRQCFKNTGSGRVLNLLKIQIVLALSEYNSQSL